MIVFVTTAAHDYTIRSLMEDVRTPLNGQLIALDWDEFLSWRRLPVGSYVLADVDRLPEADRDRASERLAALQRAMPGCRFLNHPRQSLRRPELLDALSAAGINAFAACGADADLSLLRYPVFVRSTIEHDRPLTALVNDAVALREALQMLSTGRPETLRDLLVVEFVDVRNEQGLFEKYSAFRIADRVFASDLSVSTGWVCKGDNDDADDDISKEWVERDMAFLRSNPHEAQLRAIFELAHIEYGRIDYAFHRGALQVFEINTNPMRASGSDLAADWLPSVRYSDAAFFDALKVLQPASSSAYYRAVDAAGPVEKIGGRTFPRRLARRLLRASHLLHWEHDIFRLRNRLRPRRASTPAGHI